jgi:type II secretory pathway pseudopilin PulG
VELLVVVVIVGILSAIAVPRFANTKGKANLASLKSDLRNLATVQESYFYDHREYASGLDSLNFKATGVVEITVVEATPDGWSATAIHPESAPHFCTVYYGTASPITPATIAGAVACQ